MKIVDKLSSIFKKKPLGELKHVSDSIDYSIETLVRDLDTLELEYYITTSDGYWLDEWGSWFGVIRSFQEDDEPYRRRILSSITTSKNTVPAIIDAVRKYYNDPNLDVQVYHPYTNIKKQNISTFSGEDKFSDGTYYRTSTIDILIPGNNIPLGLVHAISKIKASGIVVYFTGLHILELNSNYTIPEPDYDIGIGVDLFLSEHTPNIFSDIRSEKSGHQILFSEIINNTQLFINPPLVPLTLASDTFLSNIWDVTIEELSNTSDQTLHIEVSISA